MAYQSHHYSATLPSSVCLTVFLHHALRFRFFCLLCSVHHVHSMHHSSSVYFSCYTLPPSTRTKSLSTTTLISSLFFILIVSVHLVHAYAQYFCMLLTTPLFSPSGSSLPLHIATTSLPRASTHSLITACSPHVESSS
jgi:hypothetical protein